MLPGCEALWSVGGRLRLVTCVSSSRTPGSASPRNERKPEASKRFPWRFQNFKRNFPPAFWEKTFKHDFKWEKFVHVTQLSKARFAPISPLLLTWPETFWELVMYLHLKAVVLALLSSFYIFLLPDMICDSSLTIPRRRCNIAQMWRIFSSIESRRTISVRLIPPKNESSLRLSASRSISKL